MSSIGKRPLTFKSINSLSIAVLTRFLPSLLRDLISRLSGRGSLIDERFERSCRNVGALKRPPPPEIIGIAFSRVYTR